MYRELAKKQSENEGTEILLPSPPCNVIANMIVMRDDERIERSDSCSGPNYTDTLLWSV